MLASSQSVAAGQAAFTTAGVIPLVAVLGVLSVERVASAPEEPGAVRVPGVQDAAGASSPR